MFVDNALISQLLPVEYIRLGDLYIIVLASFAFHRTRVLPGFAVSVLTTALLLVSTTAPALSKHYPQSVVARLEAAENLIGQKDYEKAKEQINSVLKLDPQCAEALNNMGVIYLRLRDFDKAKEYFETALKIDPNLPTSLNNLGQIFYFKGSYDQAIETYKSAIACSSVRDTLLLTNLADALTANGDFKEANNYYQEVLEINPAFPQALLGSANLCFHIKCYDRAYEYAVLAIKAKPAWALAYYQLGRIETARDHKPLALKSYLLSLNYEQNPNYAKETKRLIAALDLNYYPGNQSNQIKYQPPLAKAPGRQGTNLSADTASHFSRDIGQVYNLATLTLNNDKTVGDNWQKAESELETLLKQARDPVLLNDLGLVKAAHSDLASAQSLYLKAIKLSKGKCINAYYNLGQTYRLKGDFSAAKAAFKEAIAQASDGHKTCPLANNALALILKGEGDTQAALRNYKVAISGAGANYPVIHYNYAILLEKTNQAHAAANEYKLYLKLSPKGINVERAEARLERLGADS